MKSLFPSHTRTTVQAAFLLCLGLAGCAAPPAPKPPPEPAIAAPEPPPAPEPAPAPAEPPAPQPLPANEVQPALRAVANQLQEGDTESAAALLRRVLATDPAQPLALSYLRQIESDPQSLYPRESYTYTVRAGESLSTIARDRMKDTYQFYGLARYNGIKVPRQLSTGQVIRIPGRAPAASAMAPAPAPVAAPAPAPAAAPTAAVSPERQTANRIAALTKQARTAFARQDLCNAMRRWDEVLALDPDHAVAKAERQKCLELMDRLRQQGGKLAC